MCVFVCVCVCAQREMKHTSVFTGVCVCTSVVRVASCSYHMYRSNYTKLRAVLRAKHSVLTEHVLHGVQSNLMFPTAIMPASVFSNIPKLGSG